MMMMSAPVGGTEAGSGEGPGISSGHTFRESRAKEGAGGYHEEAQPAGVTMLRLSLRAV